MTTVYSFTVISTLVFQFLALMFKFLLYDSNPPSDVYDNDELYGFISMCYCLSDVQYTGKLSKVYIFSLSPRISYLLAKEPLSRS